MMLCEHYAFEDASWHIFMKQSKKHTKITHLLTSINHSPCWTHPTGCMTPHMEGIVFMCNIDFYCVIAIFNGTGDKLNR